MACQHRILIVDDHPSNVALLEELLGDDYQVQTAASGEDALAVAPAFQPDLVLLDIMMPGLGGYETCRRIRAHPALRTTKVLMVSAKALVSERLHGYEAGADDYITKPFDAGELLAKVQVYLRLKTVEEVDQLKSTVLTLLSHETRTPLNGILAPVQMLLDAEEMAAAERAMWLGMVQESATALHRLVEKVCMLSAMSAGQWDFQYTLEDLCIVTQRAVGTVAAAAAACEVTILYEGPTVALTSMDPSQIHQVITALLENALRFSPRGARIEMRVGQAHDHVCLTVTDQGSGIAPDVLPQVFEAFASADIAHHTRGHGLSLAIARQIVLAHHGTIAVESTPGLATTFSVRLPAAAGAASGERIACREGQGTR
jgi:signal transduction histidine kinase